MLFRRLVLLVSLLLAFIQISRAQFYSTGEPPASLRWRQMNSGHFRVVYPAGNDSMASHLTSLLEKSQQFAGFNSHTGKFPVLLHTTSVVSNGYVTWAPRRMELIAVPPQDGYAQDWFSQLTLHEYRHVEQLSRLHQGFTAALSVVTGEIATGGVSSLIPAWFYEGDAVVNETRHSQSGRGRVASFEMPLRTHLLEQEKFSYNKAFFGSFRDFVPSPYVYGYHMISYGNALYGDSLWLEALRYTARNPYFIWPVAFYLRKNTGMYKTGLYHQTMDSIKALYNKQEKQFNYSIYSRLLVRPRRAYTSYSLPLDAGNGNVVALKTGLDNPAWFVAIDTNGSERKIVMPGYTAGLKADLNNGRLVWDEIAGDPRWNTRQYSEIRILDLQDGEVRNLTEKTRYFSPDFSPDGKAIAVAETDAGNRHWITLIDPATAAIKSRMQAPANRQVQMPGWISDSLLVAVTVSAEGKRIEIIDPANGSWETLLGPTFFDIAGPVCFRHYLLFRSAYGGVENIFALDLRDRALYQVTFSRFGAFHISVASDESFLLFSEYTAEGYHVVRIQADTLAWKPILPPRGPASLWERPEKSHPAQDFPAADKRTGYASKPYAKWQHLAHFHSWVPFYSDLDDALDDAADIEIYPGVMLFTQNLLSTLTSSIGYKYQDGNHVFAPVFSWRGWYPVVEFSAAIGGPARALSVPEGAQLPSMYQDYKIKSYIPLAFDRGKNNTWVIPQVEYQYTNTAYYEAGAVKTGIDYLHLRFYINHFRKASLRDLFPVWGQYAQVTGTYTPGDVAQFGSIFSAEAGFYFPGLLPHHHLHIGGGFQLQRPEKYYLPLNRIDFPRGYQAVVSEQFTSITTDYAFPVVYPDFSLGSLLYLKRIRAALFYDRSYGINILEGSGDEPFTGSYQSVGSEILADFHLIRIIFPISAGLRIGYLPEKRTMFTEVLFSIRTGGF
jgi:hypothetical protein